MPFAHTPGPWTDCRRHLFADIGEGFKVRDAAGNQIVAVVRGPLRPERSRDEWEANARLVAAAPSLLDCLLELVALAELDPENTPGTDLYTAIAIAKETTRPLIESADGEVS